jgi:excisionase family DNA binding protein
VGSLSVAQAAERLGVSVPRIHQRIADGSLAAERIGSQWVVDERSLLRIQERSKAAGRPLSARSAWAVIAASEGDRDRLYRSGSAASARAPMQLRRLLEPAGEPSVGEEAVRELAVSLRSILRNRAERLLFRAAPADLPDLRSDERWAALVDFGASGIASGDVEAYVAQSDVDRLVKDYLLVDADREANVVLHVIPDGQHPFPNSRLRLAADLAERRGPREEARAAQLLHELALERKEEDQ